MRKKPITFTHSYSFFSNVFRHIRIHTCLLIELHTATSVPPHMTANVSHTATDSDSQTTTESTLHMRILYSRGS